MVEKKSIKKEKQIREWAFRSVVSIKEIKKGQRISPDDVWSKRPGTGIPSHQIDQVIGKKTLVNIPKNKLISWQELSDL